MGLKLKPWEKAPTLPKWYMYFGIYLKKSGKPLLFYLPEPISVDSWSRFYALGLRGISKESGCYEIWVDVEFLYLDVYESILSDNFSNIKCIHVISNDKNLFETIVYCPLLNFEIDITCFNFIYN